VSQSAPLDHTAAALHMLLVHGLHHVPHNAWISHFHWYTLHMLNTYHPFPHAPPHHGDASNASVWFPPIHQEPPFHQLACSVQLFIIWLPRISSIPPLAPHQPPHQPPHQLLLRELAPHFPHSHAQPPHPLAQLLNSDIFVQSYPIR